MSKIVTLNKPIREIPADELRVILSSLLKTNGQYLKSDLMRTIIINEEQFIDIDYDRSLRSFWYSSVKPTLDKLGLLTESDQTEEGLSKWDSELSRYMADLVRQGKLYYTDLRIVDNSRKREIPRDLYDTPNWETFGYQVTSALYPNIIVATEKDTVYENLKKIASLLGLSVISGKGQNSLAAMENLLLKIGKNHKNIYILSITDYDPSGYYIAETFYNQITDLSIWLGINSRIHSERVGITPDQLTPKEVEQNKYSPKKVNIDKWMEKTGGINGEPKGLELDALTPERITDIFVTSLKKYIDADSYQAMLVKSFIQNIVLKVWEPKISAATTTIYNEEKAKIHFDFDVFECAKKGSSSFPISLLQSERTASIKKKAIEYLLDKEGSQQFG